MIERYVRAFNSVRPEQRNKTNIYPKGLREGSYMTRILCQMAKGIAAARGHQSSDARNRLASPAEVRTSGRRTSSSTVEISDAGTRTNARIGAKVGVSVAVDVPAGELPKRIRQQVSRLVRDTSITRKIKALYGSQCQLCGGRVVLSHGEFYAEAHHLRPLAGEHRGPDIPANVICVCPNCHARLDYAAVRISSRTLKIKRHRVAQEFIDYHNRQCGEV